MKISYFLKLGIFSLIAAFGFLSVAVSTPESYVLPDELEVPILIHQEEIQSFKHSPQEVFTDAIMPIIAIETVCTIPAKIPAELQDAFNEATKNIPCKLIQSLRTIEIFEDPEGQFPRALANGRKLKIRKDAITKPEFVRVLEHELGHVVDLGYLESNDFKSPSGYKDGSVTIYKDDKSVEFYALSWNKDGSKKDGITRLDFVGGYSAGDMFEDFAETFLMYIEHGKEFRGLATQNPILEKKYEFMKLHVFDGKEFETGQDFYDEKYRPWDVTKF